MRTLYDKVRKSAFKEHKVPVVTLADKNRHGFLVVVHCDLLDVFITEYLAGLSEARRDEFEGMVRGAYLDRHEIDPDGPA